MESETHLKVAKAVDQKNSLVPLHPSLLLSTFSADNPEIRHPPTHLEQRVNGGVQDPVELLLALRLARERVVVQQGGLVDGQDRAEGVGRVEQSLRGC